MKNEKEGAGIMNTHSSGYYSIDEEYTIIGFNDTARRFIQIFRKG